MAENVIMPQAGQDIEFGSVVEWKKAEGDSVKKGEIVCLVETEKVTLEIECPADGVLLKILVPAGGKAKVLEAIGIVGQAGEAVPDAGGPAAAPAAEAKAEAPDQAAAPAAAAAPASSSGKIAASGKAKKLAKEAGVDLAMVQGTGPKGRITAGDVEQFIAEGPKVNATSAAKALAAEKSLDLTGMTGSGPGGRIEIADVEKALTAQAAQAAGKEALLTPAEEMPIIGVRRAVFENMHRSLATQAQITLHSEAVAAGLVKTRQEINTVKDRDDPKISFNALIIKAIAMALAKHPKVNVSVSDDVIKVWRQIHIGVAVDLGKGLIVPKVRNADKLTVSQIQAELNRLVQAAREGKLMPDDMTSGTFTLTNLGAWDIDFFTPIVNNPESAILGTGRIVDKPVVVAGQVQVAPCMGLSLTIDHRVIDGAPGAAFLKTLKTMIEQPALML